MKSFKIKLIYTNNTAWYLSFLILFQLITSCKNIENSGISGKELELLATSLHEHSQKINTADYTNGFTKSADYPEVVNAEIVPYEKTYIKGLNFMFSDSGGFADIPLKLLGLNADWMNAWHLQLDLYNPEQYPITIRIALRGPNGMITDTVRIKQYTKVFHNLDLDELPLIEDAADSTRSKYLQLGLYEGEESAHIVLTGIHILPYIEYIQQPVVDKFGQRYKEDWPDKIKTVVDFRKQKEAEKDQLDADNDSIPFSLNVNEAKRHWSRGFFYVSGRDDKWSLITPEGYEFWNLGITGASIPDINENAVFTGGRKSIFEQLPSTPGKYSQAFSAPDRFNFYVHNILEKYNSIDEWEQVLAGRLKKWGFNSVIYRNYKDSGKIQGIPYIFTINTHSNTDLLISSNLCDYFDPSWQNYADSLLSGIEGLRNDKFLLGYLIDDCPSFFGSDLLKILPEDAPARSQWEILVKKNYSWSLNKLNTSLQTNYASWDSVRNLTNIDKQELEDIYAGFEQSFAEKYFSTIARTINKYDPLHLYLGCLFQTDQVDDQAMKKAGRYADIIYLCSAGNKLDSAALKHLFEQAGKPLIVENQNLPLNSDQDIPSMTEHYNNRERGQFILNQTEFYAKQPFVVGVFWNQLTDKPVLVPPGKDKNKLIGFVSITDLPYNNLTGAIVQCSDSIYVWRNSLGNRN